MPDWAIHMALGAGVGKCARLTNLRLILLGTLLPDIPAVLGTLSDLGCLPVDHYRLILILLPLSSYLAILIFCGAAALLTSRPLLAFGLLTLGAVTHVVADLSQISQVQMPFYPWSFYIPSLSVHNYGARYDLWISVASVAALIGLRFVAQKNTIIPDWRRAGWALLLVAGFSVMAAVTTERIVRQDVLHVGFLSGVPTKNKGDIRLVSCRVVDINPLVVVKGRRRVQVVCSEKLETGDVVSIWGRFQDDRIVADLVVRHAVCRKIIFSLLGGILFLLYWIRLPLIDGRYEPACGRENVSI